MPIQVSPSNNLSKQTQLKKEAIVREDGTTMTVDEYKAMYKEPQQSVQKSGAETKLIHQPFFVLASVAMGLLM